jgi:hypothetical protein
MGCQAATSKSHLINKTGRARRSAHAESQKQTKITKDFVSFVNCGVLEPKHRQRVLLRQSRFGSFRFNCGATCEAENAKGQDKHTANRESATATICKHARKLMIEIEEAIDFGNFHRLARWEYCLAKAAKEAKGKQFLFLLRLGRI